MRLSHYFLPTLKEKPKDVVIKSHEYMVRASLIRMVGSGFYAYLPLGLRVLEKIQNIVTEEMDKVSNKVIFPSLVFKEYLSQSGRWDSFENLLFRLTDVNGQYMALAPTHEELLTDTVKSYVSSFKQFPISLYQITPKFRNEIRARFGVIRAKEFRMKDAYTFDIDTDGLDKSYDAIRSAYEKTFKRLKLDFSFVKADSGAMGGDGSEEIVVPSDIGEDEIVYCRSCSYSANTEKAISMIDGFNGTLVDFKKINTLNNKTVKDLSLFLEIEESNILKTLVFKLMDKDSVFKKWILVVLRGDYEINEVKLKNYFDATDILEEADEEDLKNIELPHGSIGIYNLPIKNEDVSILIDKTVDVEKGYYYIGANEKDFHYSGFNINNNFDGEYISCEVYHVKPQSKCINCGNELLMKRVIEIGHIFKLGDKYTKDFDWKVVNKEGTMVYPLMGCYGIGIDRLLAASIEQNHDEKGIIWTKDIAPFHIVILILDNKDEKVIGEAFDLYEKLKDKYDVLIDDTDNRPGYKFNNADLIGIPLQVIVGHKKLKNDELEIKNRQNGTVEVVKLESVEHFIDSVFKSLK